jgi:hypothetical protein
MSSRYGRQGQTCLFWHLVYRVKKHLLHSKTGVAFYRSAQDYKYEYQSVLEFAYADELKFEFKFVLIEVMCMFMSMSRSRSTRMTMQMGQTVYCTITCNNRLNHP